jgi:hypothetical protein
MKDIAQLCSTRSELRASTRAREVMHEGERGDRRDYRFERGSSSATAAS